MRNRRLQTPKRHLGYVRVSGFAQKESGVSLEAQEERIRAHAAQRGVVLDEIVHDDGRSGSSVKARPGMTRILAMVASGEVASLTVFKLDRGFRSVNDMAQAVSVMQKNGCEFVSVSESIDTTTAVGKVMLNVLGAFAQFERDLGGERTTEALAHLKSQGKAYSKVTPYGYQRNAGDKQDVLVKDNAQYAVLERIKAMTAEGAGPTAIARTLNAEGVSSPGGSQWYASSVASVLHTAARFA